MSDPDGPEGRQLPSWHQLSTEQQHILNEAFMSHQLIDALNAWKGHSAWKEKGKYAPALAVAARYLVELGLVNVWEEPAGIGEAKLLFRDEAANVVGEPSNWWREDWDDDSPNGEVGDPVAMFTLTATEEALELSLFAR